jgi:hypothetical protein
MVELESPPGWLYTARLFIQTSNEIRVESESNFYTVVNARVNAQLDVF